jgi:peptidoglycan/xylan/chitin deacetylase (PgdA/CDA1 family)
MHFLITAPQVGRRRAALSLAGEALWHVPGAFGIVRILGLRYSLRSVLFHDVSDTESSFTKGLGGSITPKSFEAALEFLTRHYTPVSLPDVLASFDGRPLPPRPVLVTFDDAYATVREVAAPLCLKFGVPAVFFVNAACLDNQHLALDNLICHVVNVAGLSPINAAVHTIPGYADFSVRSLAEVFARFLPTISVSARGEFRKALVRIVQVSERELSTGAKLYVTSEQLRELAHFNFEIGNHTYTHVHGRSLSTPDFDEEIDKNRICVETASGTKARVFSVPYGSRADLTPELLNHLQGAGYEAVFLAEAHSNSIHTDRMWLNRVSIKTTSNATLFSEIEVLPRLRSIRNSLIGSLKAPSHRKNSSLATASAPGEHRRAHHQSAIATMPTVNSRTLEKVVQVRTSRSITRQRQSDDAKRVFIRNG